MIKRGIVVGAWLLSGTVSGLAAPPFSCGSFAMLGGAQLICSHVDPRAPTQFCTFTWALVGNNNSPSVVGGSFLLPRGIANATVYQGSGYNSEMSAPIVLCQGQKTGQ